MFSYLIFNYNTKFVKTLTMEQIGVQMKTANKIRNILISMTNTEEVKKKRNYFCLLTDLNQCNLSIIKTRVTT